MDAFNNWRTDIMAECQGCYVDRLSGYSLLSRKKAIPCDVTGAGENDRATFTKSTSGRSNGSITSAIELVATKMLESCMRDINEELYKESVYPRSAADNFDKNFPR